MARRLRSAGFERVGVFRYSSFDRDVLDIAANLRWFTEAVIARTQATRVHLVGHSLGGIIARTYAQLVDPGGVALTCVSIGSPDTGTQLARIGAGGIARDLRPRSSLLCRLNELSPRPGLRVVGFYGERDRIARSWGVDGPSASSPFTGVRAFPGLGHVGLLFSRRVADALKRELATSEWSASVACAPGSLLRHAG